MMCIMFHLVYWLAVVDILSEYFLPQDSYRTEIGSFRLAIMSVVRIG